MAYDGSVKFDTSIDTNGFKTGMSKIKSLAGGLVSAVGTAITAVSGGIVAAGTAAVNVGMDFESAMSKVSSISGATGEQLQALTDKAKKMGATTKFSATESAEAFQYMAMAGWDTQSMLDGIDGIMNLSAADGLDLATTSDIVTDALTAFGLSAKDSTHFADVLAKTSSSANTNVSMLGESFKYVAPLAGAMKYSVEDVSLALGLMANASVKGSMAGTSLKTAIANLSKPTKMMKNEMDKLGISMTDSNGNALSLREIIITLRDKFKNLSETEKASAASTIFGKEAMSGMLAVINASDEDFNKLIGNIDTADGSAKKMADTLNDNLKGDITIAKSALEGLGITISETLNDGLREAVQTGTKYIDRLSKAFTDGGLSSAVEEAGKIFGELAGKIASYAPDMIQAAVTFIKSFAKGIIDNKDKIITAAKDVLNTLKNTLIELLPKSIKQPVADIIGQVGTVTGNITKTFRKVFTSKTIENAVKFAVDIIGTLTDVLTDIINAVLPAVEDGFKEIQKALNSTGFKNAVKFVKDAFKNIGKYIENVAKVVIPIFTNAISFVIQNLDIIIPLLTTVVSGFMAFKIVQNVVTWCEGFAGTVKTLVGKLTDFIGKLTATTTATVAADGATKAFNTTLAANPAIMVATIIGTLVSALLVLGTYLATSTGKTKELWDATASLKEQQEKTAESAENLGEKLGSVGEYAQQFSDDIDKAKSSLDGVSDSAITDTQKMSELQTDLEETQQKFNEIAGKYSDGRKQMTNDEIKSLEGLFEKMRELSKKELELTKDYQDAAKTQAETWASTFKGNADEYAEASKSYIKAAEETRDKVISAADSQYQAQVLNINKMTGLSEQERQKKLKQAQKDHDTAVNNAKKECADT
ncbi:MAG: phage tail tape measure protein, partial [Clostridia bacterium]|nr:phage tail tape measure protein [Clostridia bacterium]